MRMWMVPPEGMCDNHLLGEHRELHMLAGAIESGQSKQLEGLAESEFIDLSKLEERHEELVAEMERRGWDGHDSPLSYDKVLEIGEVDEEHSKNVLNADDCECSFR